MKCAECGIWAGHKMDCSQRTTTLPAITWTGQVSIQGSALVPTETQALRQPVPLVAGSVIGIRAWRGDGHQLWPVAVQGSAPWQPGENLSRCYVGQSMPGDRCSNPFCQLCNPEQRHRFEASCTCGFYAVFHPRHVPQGPAYRVNGVIEGYGRVVLGPGGFRASKARVLALCPADLLPVHSLRPDLPPQWRQVPWFRSLHAAVTEFPVTDPTPYLPPPVTRVIEGESQ